MIVAQIQKLPTIELTGIVVKILQCDFEDKEWKKISGENGPLLYDKKPRHKEQITQIMRDLFL